MGTVALIIVIAIVWYAAARWEENRRAMLIDDVTFVIDDNKDFYCEAVINPQTKILAFYQRTPDCDPVIKSIYQYRFEGRLVFIRAIAIEQESIGGKLCKVRDGVVAVADIEEYYSKKQLPSNYREDAIEDAKKEIEWQEINNGPLALFIFSKHPELTKAA